MSTMQIVRDWVTAHPDEAMILKWREIRDRVMQNSAVTSLSIVTVWKVMRELGYKRNLQDCIMYQGVKYYPSAYIARITYYSQMRICQLAGDGTLTVKRFGKNYYFDPEVTLRELAAHQKQKGA